MNLSFETILNHPVMESLGWVLLHFLWQGAAVAVVLFLVLTVLRRVSANARYLISCFALLMTATLPAITWTLLPEPPTRLDKETLVPFATAPVDLPNWTVGDGEAAGVTSESFGIQTTHNYGVTLTPPAVSSMGDPPQNVASVLEQVKHWLRPWIPFLTCAWLAGVLTLSTRLLFTWIQVQRLQQRGIQSPRPEHQALLQRLAARLKISRTVRLLESVMVEVPTVIGWLKPVILLPVASVNSLTVQQLEAILAHELAHIRRADYAVNLVQSLIETLLFYHPAVWWMSARIRQEREHCCDDLATSISGDAASYVAALVRMEELRCEPRSVAVAARGGDLLTRAKRLLVPSAPDRLAPRWLTGAFAMAIAATIVCVPLLKTSQAEPATAQDSQTTPGNTPESTAAADEEAASKKIAKKDPEPVNLDEITPAEMADRIEEARKRYASVEYTASIEQTRNTSAFQPDAKPTLVNGTGSIVYRADGERWFCDLTSFSYQVGSTKTYPTQTVSSFDGSIHRVIERQVLKICQEDPGAHQYAPAEFFWKSGISSDWVLSALRRPEAKLIERIQMAETSCLNVKVEWSSERSDKPRSFDIMICPEQGWLVRRVIIEDGGELVAEWSINDVAKTESGLHYPVEFKVLRPETDNTPSTIVNISKFQERTDFEPHEFRVPNPIGIDIVDYRSGFAWHNDPWWNELAPWARENLDWPQPDLRPLATLQSYSPPELAGTAAPELVAGEWLNQPGKLAWDRPERTVTVLYFFGGRLIEPTPEQIAALSHLQRKYADGGLEIIGIASRSETTEMTRQAIRELVPSFPIMIDAKAGEADISKDVIGAEWGANFARYQLKPYTGTVIVGRTGNVTLLLSNIRGRQNSQLENLVRDELLKSNGTSDPPSLRRAHVNRISQLVRGTAASPEELAAAVNDPPAVWLQNAQQAMAGSIPDAQLEFLKSRGLTVQKTLQEIAAANTWIPEVVLSRRDDEWKKRAAAATGSGIISGVIREEKGGEFTGAKATLVVEPFWITLFSNSPGGRRVVFDRTRTRKIDTNERGEFTIDQLPKGNYQVSVVVPGKPRTKKNVHLVSHESQAELNVDLTGRDTITGKVTDAAGNAIPKAVVKAVKRYGTQKSLDARQHSTDELPAETQTTNADGEFTFGSLFEGAYQFEVSAEGFETTTTEPVPAGYSALRVILKPIAQDQAAVESKAIVGTVVHQGQPVANARVGLQAARDLKRFGNNESFVTTAVTGDDGQYVLTVPNTVDSKSSVAVWAVAEGYQPTRENIVMNVSEASATLQNITLAKSSGCVLQISDANGTPIPKAVVLVPSQRLPESIDFEIPKDWRDLVSGTTDAEGMVSLPFVVPEAMTEVQIQVPGQDSLVVATGNYFTNAKPAAKAPHHHFKLPKSGSLEGKIEVEGGPLPQDLTLEISTETSMTDEPRQLQTWGVATVKVGADGRFKVDSIAAGTLNIKHFLPLDQPLREELPRNVQVIAGETTSLPIDVGKGVLLRGRIVASDTGKGLPGIHFQILYGSSLHIIPPSSGNRISSRDRIDITTDKEGFYKAKVPSGLVVLRIDSQDEHYSQVEDWSPRATQSGSAFKVPDVEEFELEPIKFVPSKVMDGQLVDQDGQPLVDWSVYGYPDVPRKPTGSVRSCFGKTTSDGDGKFSGLYPSTFPPVVWKVSHRGDWRNTYQAKVISQDPLILQVDTNPAPLAPLRNAANSGDMADDDAIAASGLTGKWSLQSMQWNGIKVPEEQCRQTTMTIEGHQLTIDKHWSLTLDKVVRVTSTGIEQVTRVAEGGFTADTGLAGAIRLNSTQMPYEIDLTINGMGSAEQEEELGEDERAAIRSGNLKVYGLCTVNGDELQLCLRDARMDTPLARPTEFSAAESSERTLFVFKRIQP
jgi:uncharacterized protein (TIGR03067 family)